MTVFSHREFDGISVVALNRHGGASAGVFSSLNLAQYVGDDEHSVSENLHAVVQLVGADSVAVLRAEHGNTVHVVGTLEGVHELPLGDGAVTNIPGVALLALAADCVTGAIVDPVNKVIGVFHAGWKGVLAQVAAATWSQMQTLGAQSTTSHAVLGPSICRQCYEVQAERVDQFRNSVPECVVDDRHLDISAGIHAQLTKLGIETDVIAGCTFEDDTLFSYRRAAGEPTGRGGLIVSMQKDVGE